MRTAVALGSLLLLTGVAFAEPGPHNTRTLEATPDRLLVGTALYRVCAPCHGASGEGKPGVAARLKSPTFLEAIGDEQLVRIIEEGRSGTAMVAWKGVLTRAQIEGIVVFLRAQVPTKPAKLDESPVKGDVAKGEALFKRSCATCHDPTGDRYRQWGTSITGRMFLAQVSDGFLRHLIKNGKSGTAMQPFKGSSPLPELNLRDEDVEHVVAWMRAQSR